MSLLDLFSQKTNSFDYPYGLKPHAEKPLSEIELLISLTGVDDVTECMANLFCYIVLKHPPTFRICEQIKEEMNTMKASIDGIEAQAFDMWVTCRSLTHALKALHRHIDVEQVLDKGHLYVLQCLVDFGVNEENVMHLQNILQDRYSEYDAALSGLIGRDDICRTRLGTVYMQKVLNTNKAELVICLMVSVFIPIFFEETSDMVEACMQ